MNAKRDAFIGAVLAAIESSALQTCARDIARLTGEPLEPLMKAAVAPLDSILQLSLKRRVDRYITVASVAEGRPAGDALNWTQTVAWLELFGVPEW